MTAIDPFTTPAEAEREARIKQARDMLARAAGVEDLSTYNYDTGRRSYKGGVQAMRDALVGQGHATLAVDATLGRVATALERLAALPTALDRLNDTVREGLDAAAEQVRENGTQMEDLAKAIREHTETVNDDLDNIAEVIDRVRWWQWRRRWFNRRQRAAAVQEIPAEVYTFRVDLRGAAQASDAPLASITFPSVYDDAHRIALKLLPDLCAEADVPVHPDHVYGRIFRSDRDGAFHHVDSVFLPDATVIQAPPEGF
jgi:hypothetical protein